MLRCMNATKFYGDTSPPLLPRWSCSCGRQRSGLPISPDYQPQLGAPWFKLFGWPIYQPHLFLWWWFGYDAYAHDILVQGGYIAAAGGIAALAVAIALAVLRAREPSVSPHMVPPAGPMRAKLSMRDSSARMELS